MPRRGGSQGVERAEEGKEKEGICVLVSAVCFVWPKAPSVPGTLDVGASSPPTMRKPKRTTVGMASKPEALILATDFLNFHQHLSPMRSTT